MARGVKPGGGANQDQKEKKDQEKGTTIPIFTPGAYAKHPVARNPARRV